MKKYFPLTLVWLLLPGCVNQENVEKEFQNVKNQYPVNVFLTQDIPLYSVKPNQGTIVLQASFKEQQKIRKIVKGSWCHYLYKITYDHIRIFEGSWNEKEVSFFCRDSWPTKESGIMLKKAAWPFRSNEDLIFELTPKDNLFEIVSYYPCGVSKQN